MEIKLNVGIVIVRIPKRTKNWTMKCIICDKSLQKRKNNRRMVCTSCANDCLNGMFGNIKRTIDKRISKEITKFKNSQNETEASKN